MSWGGAINPNERVLRIIQLDTTLVIGAQNYRLTDNFLQEALNARKTYARILSDLTDYVTATNSLDIGKKADDFLYELRKLGAPLRSTLRDIVSNEQELIKVEEQEKISLDKPILYFLSDGSPFLWDMLYDEKNKKSYDWKNFWGFKVPTSYWLFGKNRESEIKLRYIFSAISEELKYAHTEINHLYDQLDSELKEKKSLNEFLRERVLEQACEQRNCTRDEAEKWLVTHSPQKWLSHFMLESIRQNTESDLDVIMWKDDALRSLFKSTAHYDLFHFACHCDFNEETEFLSNLNMMIAGERIHLDVSFMKSELHNLSEVTLSSGPLVFLNTCGSAQWGTNSEPPGFPEAWINNRQACAVIATLLPIPDVFAEAFANKFYSLLRSNLKYINSVQSKHVQKEEYTKNNKISIYLADVLFQTRQFFIDKYNNPLGLAYILYACDGAHIKKI